MPRLVKEAVCRAFRYAGLEISRVRSRRLPFLRELFDLYEVEAIFDIGANVGQSAEGFRALGFRGKIVSFEPIECLFKILQQKAERDPNWFVERTALGERVGDARIHVSGGLGGASSILPMTGIVLTHAPDQRVVRQETVSLKTLDSVADSYYAQGDRLFLKLDVQGYERRVLEGGPRTLERVIGMKIEMSLVEHYVGDALLTDMLPILHNLGFRAVHFEDGWINEATREVYQVDGIFFRTERLRRPTARC